MIIKTTFEMSEDTFIQQECRICNFCSNHLVFVKK